MEILATLHPDNNPNDDLFPNIKKENIPSKAINLDKLSDEVKNKLPKVISSDTLLPATKLKYLEIDGVTYSIPQRVDVTSNIKITNSKIDILNTTEKNKLCILSDTNSLAIRVVDKIESGSEELSTLSEVLPQGLSNMCCSIHDDNIYIFGGIGSNFSNTIYKFNCTNKTIETLSVVLPKSFSSACCSSYNDNIFIFGGYDGRSRLNTIYKFNCTNKTIETLSVTLPQKMNGPCCSTHNDNIYIFGGYDSNYSNAIYKFNCTNETIETLSITSPNGLQDACCTTNGDNIYIFGGNSSSGLLNTIYKFNCTNETIETLSNTLPQGLYSACCSINGSNIYIFGGYGNSHLNTIYNFSIPSFELIINNVLIYNANSDYSFDLITDQVTIPIKNVYIGDSNNTAQLASAYLYDQAQSAWVNVNTGEVLS